MGTHLKLINFDKTFISEHFKDKFKKKPLNVHIFIIWKS